MQSGIQRKGHGKEEEEEEKEEGKCAPFSNHALALQVSHPPLLAVPKELL